MAKLRLDQALVVQDLVYSRSQAESYIKLGKVLVSGKAVTKPGYMINEDELSKIKLSLKEQYVSRAALKLESVSEVLGISFKSKTVLDVGSSTGGFTDYSLKHGASKVIAVDSGTHQLHDSLRVNPLIELHEKTDIRDFKPKQKIDLVLIDVSFISLRQILPHIKTIATAETQVVAMVKPQFEATTSNFKHKGVIKNDKIRRQVLKDLEDWLKPYFIIKDKQDSKVLGAKGNQERFYLLQKV